MTINELIVALGDAAYASDATAESAVVGIDDAGTFTIRGVEVEFHEDAGGTHTVWLKLDRN